jgi:hypothetical protein
LIKRWELISIVPDTTGRFSTRDVITSCPPEEAVTFTNLHGRIQRFFLRLPIFLQLLRDTPIHAPAARRILACGDRIIDICTSLARHSYSTFQKVHR